MSYPEVSGSSGVLVVTSSTSLTATRNLVAPLMKGFAWAVENATSGGQAIQIIGPSGSGVTIANGSAAYVFCDGTNYLSSGGIVYPASGVPNSTGGGWGTSYQVGTSANNLVQLNSSAALPAVSGANLTNLNGANLQSSTVANAALANSSVTINSTPCTLGGSCTVGNSLGGTLSNSNLSAGANITATVVSGSVDGTHSVQVSATGAVTGGATIYTLNFTASRGHTTFCSFALSYPTSALTVGELPIIFSGSSTSYTLNAGPDGLSSGQSFTVNVSCP